MTWFKVDDSLAFHRKVVAAGNAAMGLWVRAGAWCAQQLSDGQVPAEIARTLGKPSEIKRLVAVGLWEIDGDSYRFHDWFQSNPSRVEVEERRAAEARKKATWRARRAGQQGGSTGDSTGDSAGDSLRESPRESSGESRSSRPDQPRPDPSSSNEEEVAPRKRGHRLSTDFVPDDDLRGWARGRGFTDAQIDEMTERFRDHWLAATGSSATKHDWRAAWRNWVGRENPRRVPGGALTVGRSAAAEGGLKPWDL